MENSEISVVAGSYDRFLFGFQCSTSTPSVAPSLKRSFTHAAHKGPVKCIASAAPYIASGGADDLIHLYDKKTNADLGFLMNPGEGAVSAIAFHSEDQRPPSHLLSGAADGSISVWQAGGDWLCLKTLRGHKKEICSIAIHPSGRVALSTARDSTLQLWNLVRGKSAHASSLKQPAEHVAFSPNGDLYSLLAGSEVCLHEIGLDEPRFCMKHDRRPQCLAFHGDHVIWTGSEDGSVRVWDARSGQEPVRVLTKAHASRIRGMVALSILQSEQTHFASASTDGVIKLWDSRKLENASGSGAVAEAATGARLTCLTAMDASTVTQTAIKKASMSARGAQKAAQDTEPANLSKTARKSAKEPGKPKAKHPKAVAESVGVAHDGVVDFPDATGKTKRKSRKQKGKRKVSSEAVSGQEKLHSIVPSRKHKGQSESGLHGIAAKVVKKGKKSRIF